MLLLELYHLSQAKLEEHQTVISLQEYGFQDLNFHQRSRLTFNLVPYLTFLQYSKLWVCRIPEMELQLVQASQAKRFCLKYFTK